MSVVKGVELCCWSSATGGDVLSPRDWKKLF